MNYAKKIFLSLNALMLISGSLFAMGASQQEFVCTSGEEERFMEANNISFLRYAFKNSEALNKKSYFTIIDEYNRKLDCQMTPLEYAASIGNVKLIEFLIKKGAGVSEEKQGQELLYFAVRNGHTQAAKFFIERMGVEINAEGTGYLRPIHWAAMKGHIDTVKMLIEKGADVNARDFFTYTSLHHAAMCGHAEVVKLLVAHGAKISAKDQGGLTALEVARLNKQGAMAVLLEKYAQKYPKAAL